MGGNGILNLVISAVAAGLATFIGYFSAGGSFDKAGISAAVAAAIAAAVNHLRQPPR